MRTQTLRKSNAFSTKAVLLIENFSSEMDLVPNSTNATKILSIKVNEREVEILNSNFGKYYDH